MGVWLGLLNSTVSYVVPICLTDGWFENFKLKAKIYNTVYKSFYG